MKEITDWEEIQRDSYYWVFNNAEYESDEKAHPYDGDLARNVLLLKNSIHCSCPEDKRVFGPIQLPTLEDVLKECGE